MPPESSSATPAPLDANALKAKQLEDERAFQEMNQLLDAWEAQSKKVTSLDVAFDRIATARGYPVPDTPEQKAWLRDIFVGADLVSAPEGRQSVARGVSPWNPAPPEAQPRRGESDYRPSGANSIASGSQGLTPLATDCRPSGAENNGVSR